VLGERRGVCGEVSGWKPEPLWRERRVRRGAGGLEVLANRVGPDMVGSVGPVSWRLTTDFEFGRPLRRGWPIGSAKNETTSSHSAPAFAFDRQLREG
jgi:hypothetical protein